jgi:DNA repair exonuclease SbcCD ATPase subunit
MRWGACEFLPKPIIKEDLKRSLTMMLKQNPPQEESTSKIITIYSNKGGIGKTTIASNLAIELTKTTGDKVALVDLNLQLGDISTFLNLNPAFDVAYVIRNLVEKREDCLKQMEQIKEIINGAKPKLIALDKKEKEITADNYKIPLADLQSDYKYKATLKERGTSTVESLKTKLMSDLEVLNNEKTLLEKEKTLVDFLALMFSDTGGIKRYIANHYVPIINDLMKNMMDYMDLNYTITFNDNFDAEIIQNGMKIKYATLSKGQKARVDFATIISFVKFLKLQFGELNLLFLDELFSHVDINGMNDMIDILRNLSNDMKLNIYLIHHAKLENVMFDRVLQTKMTDGFSRIEYL